MTKGNPSHHGHHKHSESEHHQLSKKEIDEIDAKVEEAKKHQRHHEEELHKEFVAANEQDIAHQQSVESLADGN